MSFEPKSRRTPIFLGERKTSLFNRFMAKFIDGLVVFAIYFLGMAIWAPIGFLGALSYCAMQDSMWVGQSVGKRIMGLRVIEDQMGLSCSIYNSLLRNIPFLLLVVCASHPLLWIFLIGLCLPLIGLEIYLILVLESGVRLGDVAGNTIVVEFVDEAHTVVGYPLSQ